MPYTVNENTKLASLIHQNPLLLPVLNRFGVQLGFQNKTIADICEEQNINQHLLLVIINAFNDEKYFPVNELQKFPLSQIISYLKNTHKYYIEFILPKFENLLNDMKMSDTGKDNSIEVIIKFYMIFKNELLHHIQDEENNILPYMEALDSYKNTQRKKIKPSQIKQIHTDVDAKIDDLKNLIIKFLKPTYNENIGNDFLYELFKFHKDLKDHERIEDLIVFPKIKKMENEIFNE